MFKCKSFFLVLLSITVLSSCIKVRVTTNTIADKRHLPIGFAPGASFRLLSLSNHDQMLSNEVYAKITTILENKGFVVVDDAADYGLAFSFDMSSSEHTAYVPIYTPGTVSVTQGTVYNSRGFGAGGYTQTSQSSGTINYIPQNYTLFHRVLDIAIFDLKLYRKEVQDRKEACSWMQQFMHWINGSEPILDKDIWPKVQVWEGRTVSSSENADLRVALDYLLVGMFDYFGKDTYGEISRAIDYNDKEVLSILCKKNRKGI
jgi:hypothetical protein